MNDRRDQEERKKFIKEAMKEGLKEWLEEKTMMFGTWSLRTLGAAVLVALVYFLLTMGGWSHTPNIPHASEIRQ